MFPTNRRSFLAASTASLALPSLSFANSEPEVAPALGKAEHCIMVWLGGGAGQIDTWDPKQVGDPKAKKPGSYYPAIDTAIPGVQVCQHLSRCANVLDRFIPIRTTNHDVIDEHAAATDRMHTGRRSDATLTYPSVGSVVTHLKGPLDENVPAYVLMGYPSTTRGPGFLGAEAGYIYLTETTSGPKGLTPPADIQAERRARREALLEKVRNDYVLKRQDIASVVDYDRMIARSLKLGGPDFLKLFALDTEPDSLRNDYGGEFGQRCLLARRLVQAGSRFIEVSHNLNFLNGTGWDVHNEGIVNQHKLIEELDRALATLVLDLENHKLLDKTLIVVATEFGRPAGFDGGGGRGHHGKCFATVMAGGGLKTGQAIGVTDELGMNIVERPVSVPDMLATIYATLGIDPHEDLYAGDRPVPITDGGVPIAELFA